MPNWKDTALLLAVASLTASVARAQSADTVRRFSLFGGTTLTSRQVTPWNLSQFEAGGSADFHPDAFPLTLRTTVAFSQEAANVRNGFLRFGTLSLDAVTRPGPRFLGLRPYLLGGVGVATRAEFTSYPTQFTPVDGPSTPLPAKGISYDNPRLNWAYLEGGGGVEFGKIFMQLNVQQPLRRTARFGCR